MRPLRGRDKACLAPTIELVIVDMMRYFKRLP